MPHIAIVYFSGYGHTAKQAQAVQEGVATGAQVTMLPIDKEGELPEGAWETLAAADGIVFGSPTYMGNAAWQFKKFADASSKPWFHLAWKDKVAAGFTNSASMNGDKGATITSFVTLAMQHGMVWVGTGMLPANSKASTRNDVNYLAGSTGLLAQSPSDSSPDEGPLPGDLEPHANLATGWQRSRRACVREPCLVAQGQPCSGLVPLSISPGSQPRPCGSAPSSLPSTPRSGD